MAISGFVHLLVVFLKKILDFFHFNLKKKFPDYKLCNDLGRFGRVCTQHVYESREKNTSQEPQTTMAHFYSTGYLDPDLIGKCQAGDRCFGRGTKTSDHYVLAFCPFYSGDDRYFLKEVWKR